MDCRLLVTTWASFRRTEVFEIGTVFMSACLSLLRNYPGPDTRPASEPMRVQDPAFNSGSINESATRAVSKRSISYPLPILTARLKGACIDESRANRLAVRQSAD